MNTVTPALFQRFPDCAAMAAADPANAGNLLNAAKKDVAWFKWVQKHYLELPSRKELQYKGLRTADDMIIAGREAGNWLTVNDGMKQMYRFGGLDRPEEDPQHVNDAAYQELIPTTDVTKVDPDRKRISQQRRLELASKWGAHIDEHGVLIDKDGKVVGGQQHVGFVDFLFQLFKH